MNNDKKALSWLSKLARIMVRELAQQLEDRLQQMVTASSGNAEQSTLGRLEWQFQDIQDSLVQQKSQLARIEDSVAQLMELLHSASPPALDEPGQTDTGGDVAARSPTGLSAPFRVAAEDHWVRMQTEASTLGNEDWRALAGQWLTDVWRWTLSDLDSSPNNTEATTFTEGFGERLASMLEPSQIKVGGVGRGGVILVLDGFGVRPSLGWHVLTNPFVPTRMAEGSANSVFRWRSGEPVAPTTAFDSVIMSRPGMWFEGADLRLDRSDLLGAIAASMNKVPGELEERKE